VLRLRSGGAIRCARIWHTVVHLADLELEVVQTAITDRETIDASREHVFVSVDATKAAERVRWADVDASGAILVTCRQMPAAVRTMSLA